MYMRSAAGPARNTGSLGAVVPHLRLTLSQEPFLTVPRLLLHDRGRRPGQAGRDWDDRGCLSNQHEDRRNRSSAGAPSPGSLSNAVSDGSTGNSAGRMRSIPKYSEVEKNLGCCFGNQGEGQSADGRADTR